MKDEIEQIVLQAADQCSGRLQIAMGANLRFEDIIRQAVKDALAVQYASDVRYVAEHLGKLDS